MKPLYFLLLFLFTFLISCAEKRPVENIDADNSFIEYIGRTDRSDPKSVRFAWPGVSISASFEGRVCNLRLKDMALGTDAYGKANHNYYNVIIDGKAPFVIIGDASKEIYKIDTLTPGAHTLIIFKRTEGQVGETVFYGFQLEKGKKLLPNSSTHSLSKRIEFIGNSITCGYGNEGNSKECKFSAETENNYLAYGALTARRLNAYYSAIAFSGKGIYQNYDKSTDETMPDLYDRVLPFEEDIKWDFKKNPTPDWVVINLGTNDFAHENPDSTIWVNTYLRFIKTIRSNYPEAKIICCIGPMMSDDWPVGNKALSAITGYLNAIVSTLNKDGDSKVNLFFFTPHYENYGCDWHPGLKTHEKMADELTTFIKKMTLSKDR